MNSLSERWLAWVEHASWQLALLVSIVAVICVLAKSASARLRHALWLLVLVKVFLPPWLATPLSIGNWGVARLLPANGAWSNMETSWRLPIAEPAGQQPPEADAAVNASAAPGWLMAAWALGCLMFWGVVGWRYLRVAAATRSSVTIDEGPARIELEKIALQLQVRNVPELLATTSRASPFLFGAFRPRIVVPRALLEELDEVELRSVLTHELVHWKRRDTWIGWLQLLAQSLFWFHPFLWWANRQLRHERECACDEGVLQLGSITPQHYGEAIVRFLTVSRGRSLAAGSLVGVFERGAKLPERLEHIMSYESKPGFGGWSFVALVAFAILFLPMSPGSAPDAPAQAQAPGKPGGEASSVPRIVASAPKRGSTGVDPGLTEISVTFDRDMGKGMSWTGGPPHFPPVDKSRQARWTDARTCVLPVKLEKGSYYRLGINSTTHQNFRSGEGVAVPPTTIHFTTAGASKEIEQRVAAPTLVRLDPENGAKEVDPGTKALRVTFNMKMGEGMSWTGGGQLFPKPAEGQAPSWSEDGKTCTLPVSLEPNHDYRLGLNSPSHNNFQSEWGVPLEPVVYQFRTGVRQVIETGNHP